MNKEEERLISYNYNELGQEFGDLIVDIRNERDKYKEVLDKIKEYIKDDNVSITQLEAGIGLLNTKDYILEILDKID